MTRWAFIGSGPSAPAQVERLTLALSQCRTITTNAGPKLWPAPDVYLLVDRVACQRYMPLARKAKESGTHLVTLHRHASAQKERGVEWFDEFIINGVDPPLPNRWSGFNQSGPFCMEYACRMGAGEVHLLGCEGYTDSSAYFDQEERKEEHLPDYLRHKISDSATCAQLQKRVQMVVTCFPQVEFYVYGQPHYQIDGANWKVCEWQ